MSVACTEPNIKANSLSKNKNQSDEKREKSAKERLLFCKCTC